MSADAFWAAQNAAIEAKAASYRNEGWSDVIVLEPGSYFNAWEHERRSKKKGGKVFIGVSHRGDVTIHEGYVSRREARRQEQAEAGEKPKRPEITTPMQNYIDLHRHAVVRSKVAAKPMLALRLALAHAIIGSALWYVRIEPQRALTDAIAESVFTSQDFRDWLIKGTPGEAQYLGAEVLTAEQRALLDSIRSGPRGASVPIRGPFAVFLHAPAYGQLAQTLGGYLRYQTGVPPRLHARGHW